MNILIILPLFDPFGGGGVACISSAAVSSAAIPNAYISMGCSLNVRSSPHSGAKKCKFLMLNFTILPVCADEFQDASNAYLRKDYETAHRLIFPLAKNVDVVLGQQPIVNKSPSPPPKSMLGKCAKYEPVPIISVRS